VEENEETAKDKTTMLFKEIPFMSEFPFDDYEITIEDFSLPLDQLGISPILLREIGEPSVIKQVDFYYTEGESSVSISLRKDDIEWIARESVKIKKLDDLRKELDHALTSKSLIDKIKSIKTGIKFLKSYPDPTLHELDFNVTLKEFLDLHEVSLESNAKLILQNLNSRGILTLDFSKNQHKAVSAFLNFRLNYVKIILGVTIAAKIY